MALDTPRRGDEPGAPTPAPAAPQVPAPTAARARAPSKPLAAPHHRRLSTTALRPFDDRLAAALDGRSHAALATAWAAAAGGELDLNLDSLNALLAASCRVGGRAGRVSRSSRRLPVHPADAEAVVARGVRAGAFAPSPATLQGLSGLWLAHEQQQQHMDGVEEEEEEGEGSG